MPTSCSVRVLSVRDHFTLKSKKVQRKLKNEQYYKRIFQTWSSEQSSKKMFTRILMKKLFWRKNFKQAHMLDIAKHQV